MTTQAGTPEVAFERVRLAAVHRAAPRLTAEQRAVLEGYWHTLHFGAGDAVDGDDDRGPARALYLVVQGQLRLRSSDDEFEVLSSGEHFGALSLLTSLPRTLTAEAVTDVTIASLSVAPFRKLTAEHPAVAFSLLEAVITEAALRISRTGLAAIVQDRSLPRRAELCIHCNGARHLVPTGTKVAQLLPREFNGKLVVAGLMDGKAVSLAAPVTSECELAPLTTAHWEGQRIYRQSLILLLLEASTRLEDAVQLEPGPSLGFAQKIHVLASPVPTPELAEAVEATMHTLVAERAPLHEEWWTFDEASEHFRRDGHRSNAHLLETWRGTAVPLVSYGTTYALQMGPLLPDTQALTGFCIVADENALLLVYGRRASARPLSSVLPPSMPHAKSARWSSVPEDAAAADASYIANQARSASRHAHGMTAELETWLDTLGITSVGAFNRACISGEVSQLIRVNEGFQEKRIGRIADQIAQRPGTRIVCIAGPSSSGKTTFSKRLRTQLQVNGSNPVTFSLDDYYVDRELTPLDSVGEYDFESFDALRTDLLQEHLSQLMAGTEVTTAHYDFPTGRSHPTGGTQLQLGDRDILMIEGIHGLNPRLLETVSDAAVFRVYVCPLMQLPFDRVTRVHASDVRLVRRIVRDRRLRGHDAATTIARWPSVRAGERANIFPYQHHADAAIDTSLIYELSALRVFAERYLLEVERRHPSYPTARRLLALLDRFVPIYPDHVPPTSLLREFIGGSGFEH